MKPMGSCDGTSEYLGVCDATDGYVRCDDAGEVVRSRLFLGHFERHKIADRAPRLPSCMETVWVALNLGNQSSKSADARDGIRGVAL